VGSGSAARHAVAVTTGETSYVDQFDSEDDQNGRPGVPVDTGRITQALRKHWRWIPTSVAVGALVGLAIAALLIKPSYTAKATILWEPPAEADPSDRSFLTQVDSIKLSSNLKEVRRRLHLKGSIDDLKEKINLLFDGQSHLVVLEATAGTAKAATALANTTVDVFLDYQRSIGRDRGSEHLKHLDADALAAQAQMRNDTQVYDVFRKEIGVADYEAELKLALTKVAELKQQLELSGAEVLTEDARQRQLTEEAAHAPATSVSATSLSNPDAVALANAQSQLTQARSHLSSDHPDVLRLEGTVASLQERIKSNPTLVQAGMNVTQNVQHTSAVAGIAASKVARETALVRREGYQKLLAAAEERLAQLSAVQNRAQQLLSAIASDETHKNELEALRVRTSDQVRNAAAGFRVVTPASAPDKPNPSARRAMVIRLPIVALVLSLLGIVAYELRGLRVHTAREAGFWANAAVIASSTWPREQTTLGALIDELSDAAPVARGTTLVVGARVNEVPLAREIAYWLSHLTNSTQRGVLNAEEPVVSEPPTRASGKPPAGPELAPASQGSALARRGSADALTIAQAWDGPPHGPSLRRASRLADRVLVVVAAGTMSVHEIGQLRSRLGRSNGIGLLLVGLNPDYVRLPDRVGEVARFWEDRAA
jgi:uncharacterized protein involved in exopolysaccharide biosynthesis